MFLNIFIIFAVAGYAESCMSLQEIFPNLFPVIMGRTGDVGGRNKYERFKIRTFH